MDLHRHHPLRATWLARGRASLSAIPPHGVPPGHPGIIARPPWFKLLVSNLTCPAQFAAAAREPAMPEAVIVATARSPIGRAFKGSLTSIRPDDLTVQMVAAALAKVPQLSPEDIDDLMLGCGLPGGEQGFNLARVVAVLLGYDNLPGTTVNRYCSSSLQTTRMALPRHQGRRGRRVHLGRRGVRQPVRHGQQRQLARHAQPAVRRRRGPLRGALAAGGAPGVARPAARTPRSPTSTSRWARPRRTSPAARDHPRGPGRVRRPVAEPGREGAGQRVLAARHHPGHPAGRHRGERRRRAAAGDHPGEGGRPEAGLPAGRDGHRGELLPAQRRRGGGRGDERHQGGRARASPRWPGSCRPA